MKANELKDALDAANAKLATQNDQLTDANTKLGKVITEIQTLQGTINANPDLPADVVASVTRLGELTGASSTLAAQADALAGQADDLNPDAPALTTDVPAPGTP